MWECQGWQRHLIIQRIIEHVLHRHLSLSPESLHVVSGQLDFALLEKGTGIDLVRMSSFNLVYENGFQTMICCSQRFSALKCKAYV